MKFVYTGEPDRYYPTLGITPIPGDVYEHETDPRDGRWSTGEDEPAALAEFVTTEES